MQGAPSAQPAAQFLVYKVLDAKHNADMERWHNYFVAYAGDSEGFRIIGTAGCGQVPDTAFHFSKLQAFQTVIFLRSPNAGPSRTEAREQLCTSQDRIDFSNP